MACNLPYSHNSISELAKSLRKSLKANNSTEIGQSEMLQLLAKAAGYQDYQSLKSKTEGNNINSAKHLIKVSCSLHEATEVFERDINSGRIIDRRHQAVTHVLASITITVSTSLTEASFKCTVKSLIKCLTEKELKKPEEKLAEYTVKHISEDPVKFFSSLNMMSNVIINLSEKVKRNYFKIDETTYGELLTHLTIDEKAFNNIVDQSNKINDATDKYDSSIKYLKDLAFSEKTYLNKEEKQAAKYSLQFIEEAMEISTEKGRGSMYSWNHEKFPGIKKFIQALINENMFDEYEKEYARRNLFAMTPGEVWLDTPSL